MQEKITKNLKKVVFLGTGGTISGVSRDPLDDLNYQAGMVSVQELVGKAIGKEVEEILPIYEQITQIDSKDMEFSVWVRLLVRLDYWRKDADVAGFLITHGTDTLEETAYCLSLMTRQWRGCPSIVLTCAMRPASSLDADGPLNIAQALQVLLDPRFEQRGVLVVCAGQVHLGEYVQKVYTDRINAFTSEPYGVLASFEKSGSSLSLNTQLIPCRGVDFSIKRGTLENIQWPELTDLGSAQRSQSWPWVEVIQNYTNCKGEMVDALMTYKRRDQKRLFGIVLSGTGNGSASEQLVQALRRAQSQGVLVWQSSRCAFATLRTREDLGFYDYHGLTPVKARIALTLLGLAFNC